VSSDAISDPTFPPRPTPDATFILPQVRAEYTPRPNLTVYARNAPSLTDGSLSSLYEENPYAEHGPLVQPTLFTTDIETGLQYSIGPLQMRPSAGFRYAPSYRYFTAATGGLGGTGVFQTEYDSARILHGGFQLVLQGITGVEASAGVTARDGSFVGEDDSIPYFSPVVADAMISVSFAEQRGLLQATGTIESPRPVDREETTDVRTYVSLDLEGSYELTSLLDVVLRIRNIAPQSPKRWARYPRPPASVTGGFRVHW